MKSFFKGLSNLIIWIGLTVLFVLFMALCGIRVFGLTPYTVLGSSMEPALPVGSLVYVEEASFESLEPSDVITYPLAEVICTHRIVSVDADAQAFVVKGDANDMEDPSPVYYQDVIGRVVYSIPLLGFFAQWIHTTTGLICSGCVLLGFLAFIVLSSVLFDDKKKQQVDPVIEE